MYQMTYVDRGQADFSIDKALFLVIAGIAGLKESWAKLISEDSKQFSFEIKFDESGGLDAVILFALVMDGSTGLAQTLCQEEREELFRYLPHVLGDVEAKLEEDRLWSHVKTTMTERMTRL